MIAILPEIFKPVKWARFKSILDLKKGALKLHFI